MEVLHLIAAGASNEEIAERLVIAIGTTKRHVTLIRFRGASERGNSVRL